MIVPQNRLLFWFSVVVLPFSFLIAVEPAALGISLFVLGGFVAVLLADALRARRVLAGVTVQLPSLARMSKDRDAKLEVRIQNNRRRQTHLRVAFALPKEIQSAQKEVAVALPPASEWSRFSWTCRPCKRGNYRLNSVNVGADSPFGFWSVQRRISLQTEIRVYPNLLSDRKDLAALFLHRGSFGLHAQRQVGKGREFEKLREYVPGDGYEDIHWKATARRGRPITKVFQIERTQELYVVIDASRLSARQIADSRLSPSEVPNHEWTPMDTNSPADGRSNPRSGTTGLRDYGTTRRPESENAGPQPATTLERFITASLVLGLAAEQQGDLFGLITFTNKVDNFVRAKNGKAHYSACRDTLYLIEPQTVAPDYDEVCTFIRLRLRRRALLVFLTALDDRVVAESFVRNMDLIRNQHLVLVNMIQPPGVAALFSAPGVASVDDLYQHLGGHLLWNSLRELEKVLQRRGVRFSLLKNERLGAELVSQYLNVKRRQML
jgi:uncharacterized protein (DUF58 family)